MGTTIRSEDDFFFFTLMGSKRVAFRLKGLSDKATKGRWI